MRKRAFASALLAPLLSLPLLLVHGQADSTSPFDAANLTGGCAAVELTVSTGYQFVVKPDVQLPRATTAIEEGASEAIASPADPGDSADGLAALGIPEAEGYIANGYPGAPGPFAGKGLSTLPAPFNSVGSALVQNPFNQALTYPYEHADAGYPNAQHPGDQVSTLGGAPNAGFGDPSGIFSLNAGAAKSMAGNGYAVADAGVGAAAGTAVPALPVGVSSLPALGITVGRVSAHSEAHVLADRVTQDATCTLDNVEVAVAGAPPIHIGAVVATVHTQRTLAAPAATGSETIEFSGVTVNGQGATIDQHGLTIGGTVVPLSASQNVSPPLTAPCPSTPPSVAAPCAPTPTLALAGTKVTTRQPNANEFVIAASGATLTITSATPVPNALPPSGLSVTPTVYTITLASLASEAYALPASSGATAPSSPSLGDLAGSFAGIVGGGLGGINSTTGTAALTQRHPGSPAVPSTLAAITVPPAQRTLVLGVASLLEAMLLIGVARNYLRSRQLIAVPLETTDLP